VFAALVLFPPPGRIYCKMIQKKVKFIYVSGVETSFEKTDEIFNLSTSNVENLKFSFVWRKSFSLVIDEKFMDGKLHKSFSDMSS
jgi:hypothetical protein